MRSPIQLFVLTSLLGCNAPDGSGVLRIGHGGSGMNGPYPMNSEAAMVHGLASGSDGIELDVQLTSDSVLVAYHAEFLEEQTNCQGLVNSMTWSQIKNCQNVNEEDSAFPIVRLDHLLPFLSQKYPTADFTLDCKLFAQGDWWPYLRTYARALNSLRSTMGNKLIAECQVEDFLRLLQLEAPSIPLYLYCIDVDVSIRRAATSRFDGIIMNTSQLNKNDVTTAHDLGLRVVVFGVGGYWSRRKALLAKVDRIQLDQLDN